MLTISRKMEYALRILKHMSEHKREKITARFLSGTYAMPFDTVSKVMQSMKNSNILKSLRGKGGGHTLKISLKDLSYSKLHEIVEDERSLTICESSNCPTQGHCDLSIVLQNLNNRSNSFFSKIYIGDLIELKGQKKRNEYK